MSELKNPEKEPLSDIDPWEKTELRAILEKSASTQLCSLYTGESELPIEAFTGESNSVMQATQGCTNPPGPGVGYFGELCAWLNNSAKN